MGKHMDCRLPPAPCEKFNSDAMRRIALEEIENLLENHPNLLAHQKEIERRLENSGNAENRMAVLGFMIEANLYELQKRLSHLISG